MVAGSLLIVQGGGPTSVFNASLASIIREALIQDCTWTIYGARFGIKGLAENDIVDLSGISPEVLDQVRDSPGAALGSSRFRPTEEDLDRCVAHLQALNVRFMIFLGGNGTMGGAQSFQEFCASRNYDLQVMGAPKTIDNDICATDRCPGFGSAARYVAQSTLDLAMDLRSLPQPVSVFETLGRDVGWLSASSILAKREEHDAPHIICLPEVPFVLDTFMARIDAAVSRIGWALAVVSEGTCYADGTPVFQTMLPCAGRTPQRPLIGGVAQHLSGLITEHLGLRCRSEKPGLIGRSALTYVSQRDRDDAELTGRECVRALADGKTGFMVTLRPLGSQEESGFELLPLTVAAGPRRAIPTEWLRSDELAVNEGFRRYLEPIVGPLHRYQPPLSARSAAWNFGPR